jgi:hypothetical protein
MKVRRVTLAVALAFGLTVASPARALADDCRDRDATDANSQAGCNEVMPALGGPNDVEMMAPDLSVPTVDADGDPIPFVEETSAPPPGNSLTFASVGE